MKKILTAAAAVAMAAYGARAMSLADASGKIAEAVDSPSVMAETVKQLAPADQTAFLAKVNAAIDAMPGSPEEKAAKYLDANKAAVKSASKENLAAMLAETFATVPPEALTVINERFAADLFNRAADPANPVSDDAMKQLAADTMKTIQDRNSGNNNEGVRDTFAVLMFLRASNGSPADLRDALVAALPGEETRDLAKNDWIPAAMGEGRDKSYEPILAASDAARAPEFGDVYSISLTTDPIFAGGLLNDLGSSTIGMESAGGGFATGATLDPSMYALPYDMTEAGLQAKPTSVDPEDRYNTSYYRGGGKHGSNYAGEPDAYPYETTR